MDLNVERYGKGEKLLFIHGAGGSSSSFYFEKQYLQRSSEVILLDLPGHGKSGGEGSRNITDYVSILTELILRDGMQGCYAVGHFTEQVKEIAMPTLIICATDDVLTPPEHSEYLNRAIRGS